MLLFAVVMILPVDVVYEIPVQGKVYPARQWSLIQTDGKFHTEENSLLKSCSESSRTFVFERGDVVDIHFNEHVHNNSFVEKGTQLITFSSMIHRLDVQRAENDKRIQQSLLLAGATPVRQPEIQASKENLELSRSNERLQQANFDRLTALYAEGVISKLELDVQLNALEVAQQETKLAERRLQSLQFGEKPEDLDVFKTRMATAESELEVLSGRMDSYNLSSPWSGLLSMAPEEGIVMQLTDTIQKVMLFPIDVNQLPYINERSLLCKKGREESSRAFEIEKKVQIVNGRQVSLGSTRVDGTELEIGLFTNCVITCDTIRLGEYIKRRIF